MEIIVSNHQQIAKDGVKVKGNYNVVTGNGNHVEGVHNMVRGNDCIITGDRNKGRGARNQYIGSYNVAMGSDAVMRGGAHNQDRGTHTRAPPLPPREQHLTLDELLAMARLFEQEQSSSNSSSSENEGAPPSPPSRKRRRAANDQVIECPANTAADVEAAEGNKTCVLCMTNVPNCVMVPCGHAVSCIGCSKRLVELHAGKTSELQCPTCRTVLEKIIQVFD